MRSATAISAGLLRELGDVALPRTLRRSRLYRTMVEGTLRFLIEQVGEVEGAFPAEGRLGDDFALRRAAGNGIEMAGILAFRASPVWVMAALADASGASRHLVREIAATLQDEGLLPPGTDFEDVDHILDGLERTAGHVAETVNTPPLDVAGLRKDLKEIRTRLASIPPERLPSGELLGGLWRELRRESEAQGRSVFQISSLMALSAARRVPDGIRWFSRSAVSAVRKGGEVVAGRLLEDYRTTLGEIRDEGALAYWTRQFRPYLQGAAAQFHAGRDTLTDRLLSRRDRS